MNQRQSRERIRQIIEQRLNKEEQYLLKKVILAEQDKLHMGRPQGINDDIQRIVKEVIK